MRGPQLTQREHNRVLANRAEAALVQVAGAIGSTPDRVLVDLMVGVLHLNRLAAGSSWIEEAIPLARVTYAAQVRNEETHATMAHLLEGAAPVPRLETLPVDLARCVHGVVAVGCLDCYRPHGRVTTIPRKKGLA